MITVHQLKKGLEVYADKEILPHLSSAKRVGLGIYLELLLNRIESEPALIFDNPAIKILGIIDGQNVDLDKLYSAAVSRMDAAGPIEIDVPMIGCFTFNRNDADKLCELIRRSS